MKLITSKELLEMDEPLFDIFGKDQHRLRYLIRAYKLPCKRIGRGQYFFDPEEVKQFIIDNFDED